MRVGLISDTHGLVRPEALAALAGVELILHAGDVGGRHVLEAFATIAKVVAIRGNVDSGGWADILPERRTVDVAGIRVHMLHDVHDLEEAPAGVRLVLSGHSHKASIEQREGVLYVNPGSAGPRRFRLPITIATMRVAGTDVSAEVIDLLG